MGDLGTDRKTGPEEKMVAKSSEATQKRTVATEGRSVMSSCALALLLLTAPSHRDRAAAVEAVAQGRPEAVETLVEARARGLWALGAALKKAEGPERSRLITALGAFRYRPQKPRATWMLRRILRSERADDRLAALAGLKALAPAGLDQILADHVDDPDPDTRIALAALLATSAGPRVADRLLARQDDPDAAVREVVLRFLAQRLEGDPQRALLARALLDPAPEVRRAAIGLAALTRDPAYREALTALARRGAPAEAELATRALTRFTGATVILVRVVADPEAPLESARLAFDFVRERRRHALDLLLPALAKLEAPRREALMAPVVNAPSPEELADLVVGLDHPNPVRAARARAWLRRVGALGDEAVAIALLEARPARAERLRSYLAARPRGGVTPQMLQRAQTPDAPETRVRAIRVIGRIGTPQVRQNLLSLLEDPAAEIRAAAATAVRDLEQAELSLVVLTVDPAPPVRAAAIEALRDHAGESAWRARLAALRDDEEAVRLAAIRGFVGTRHLEALARLENRVLLGTPRERRAAVDAIARSPTTHAAVKLVELIAHRDPQVRKAALAYVETL